MDKGYKGYRAHIREHLSEVSENIKFIVLDGLTGSGKTEILIELKKMGANILDLEKLANHRGSLLGAIGLGEQPSQKLFEGYLYNQLRDMKGLVFVEGESSKIGNLTIPKKLYEQMKREGVHVRIVDTIERRVQRLKQEYVHENKRELLEVLHSMNRYINPERLETLERLLQEEQYEKVIETLILKYYDPKYNLKWKPVIEIENVDSKVVATKIYEEYKKGD